MKELLEMIAKALVDHNDKENKTLLTRPASLEMGKLG
jgi:predicted RNA-binding protein YlqC (UPF0109 family)